MSRVMAGLMLLGLIVSLGLSGLTPKAQAAGEGAVDAYGGCMVSRKAGDLLIIIDESRSLDQNDPENARVAAAKYLLTQLNSFAARTEVVLDVSVAGFSDKYVEAQPWTKLDKPGLDRTLATVESFTTRPKGFETDYWWAMEGARRTLAAHNPDGNRCQAVVWITDGSLDVDFRETDEERRNYGETKPYLPDLKLDSEEAARQAEAESERQICRDGGLTDQLRSSGVTIFGVGLRGEEQPDYTLMRAIALGGDQGGKHCGRITEPPGSFTEASNIDELLFEFDKFSNPSQQRKTQQSGVCQGKPCPEQRHTFVLDDSVQSVHVLGSSDVEGSEVYLVTPADKEVKLEKKAVGETSTIDDQQVKINYSWQSDKTVVIDLAATTEKAQGWSGPWSVVFVDPTGESPDGKSRTSISISGDVYPTWPEAENSVLRAGDTTEVQLGLVNATGGTIDPAGLLGTVALDATLETPDGQEVQLGTGLDKNAIAAPLTLDLTDVPPGQATLSLRLAITTADAKNAKGEVVKGTALEPQTVRIPLDIQPPAGFPTLGNQVNFGTFEGRAENAPGELAVNGPGCVWVEGNGNPNVLAGPEDIGEVSISSTHNSAENCLQVEEGQQANLPLALTTTGMDNGTLNAEFTIKIAPKDDPSKVRDATVQSTASFEKPLNPVNFTLTLIVAAILGPGIPLGLLYLMKYLTAKIPGRALLAEEYPVTVEAGQVLRDGQPFALRERDLSSGMVPLANNGSRTAQAASATLQAKMGGSPFGQGYVEVQTPGRIGASSSDTRPHGKDLAARLPLNVHNHWVLLHDPQGPPEAATLLLLVGADAQTSTREKLVDDINSRVPDVLPAIRSTAGVPAGGDAGPGAPFGGGGPDQGGAPGPQPFAFGPDLGPGGQPNPFGGPGPQGGQAPFGGPGPQGAPGPQAQQGPAPQVGGAPSGSSASSAVSAVGTAASAPSANPFDPFAGGGEQQPQQQWGGQPQGDQQPWSGAPQQADAQQPQQQWGGQPQGDQQPQQLEQPAPQWGAQPPAGQQPQQQWGGQPQGEQQHPPQQQWGGQPQGEQPPPQQWTDQQPQQGWGGPQQPQEQSWGGEQQPQQPQQSWGGEQQPQPQESPNWGASRPSDGAPPPDQPEQPGPGQFRPSAPPPGTQITNPFDTGDNSGGGR
ncbi:VWA domain-containing protein [Microlunatus sp. Y2014]|uniref:vWA domain-containing protein n=1 Tax=Microlunatus sp. Y2014 TaxID=3418488 RepID=UPI003DA73445